MHSQHNLGKKPDCLVIFTVSPIGAAADELYPGPLQCNAARSEALCCHGQEPTRSTQALRCRVDLQSAIGEWRTAGPFIPNKGNRIREVLIWTEPLLGVGIHAIEAVRNCQEEFRRRAAVVARAGLRMVLNDLVRRMLFFQLARPVSASDAMILTLPCRRP